MSLLGRLDEFDGSKEDWPQYIERVNHFFAAIGIDDAGKKSAFLSSVGPATYALVRNLVSPGISHMKNDDTYPSFQSYSFGDGS